MLLEYVKYIYHQILNVNLSSVLKTYFGGTFLRGMDFLRFLKICAQKSLGSDAFSCSW